MEGEGEGEGGGGWLGVSRDELPRDVSRRRARGRFEELSFAKTM